MSFLCFSSLHMFPSFKEETIFGKILLSSIVILQISSPFTIMLFSLLKLREFGVHKQTLILLLTDFFFFVHLNSSINLEHREGATFL